ncbi:MAG TPA: ABC transporter permease subunit [Pseudomonadota bacterium]|nr:ABC transporter permease subunit [Pseudomonadota bacterium]
MRSPLILSLLVASVATTLSLVLGVAFACVFFLLGRRRLGSAWSAKVAEMGDALLSLPLVLPPTVLGYYLLTLLGRQSVLGRMFETVTGSPLTFTPTAAVVAAMVSALPAIARSTRAALLEADPLYFRAAASLGASPVRALWTVGIPICRRQIAAATMLAFARALGDFGVTLMIAGNIPGYTQTASLAVYDAVQAGRERDALALIIPLSLFALFVLYGVGRLQEKGTSRK